MTPRQFIREYQARIDALNANRKTEVERIVFDLIGQVRLRLRADGLNAQGRPFTPYTPDYAKRRAKAGYQVAYVDFTRTGAALNNVRPTTVGETATSVTVVAGPVSPEQVRKLEGQFRKRGNILEPSKEERDIAAESNRRRVLKYLGA